MKEMTLNEWTVHFVKHKDVFLKKLMDYEVKENRIFFHFKDKDQTYFVVNLFDNAIFDFMKETGYKCIVCSSDRQNLKFLVDNWSEFIVENLTLVFAETISNKKMLINPFVHNKICDVDSLQLGLESMFENAFEP